MVRVFTNWFSVAWCQGGKRESAWKLRTRKNFKSMGAGLSVYCGTVNRKYWLLEKASISP